MLTFTAFLLAVTIYVTFLLWCLLPIIRRQKRRWLGWLRVCFAFWLLGASLLPPLAWPIMLPLTKNHLAAAEHLSAVILFPWTLPNYVLNVFDYTNATAIVVDITYPIEISGVRYEPRVRTACILRRAILLDLGVTVRPIKHFPTATGGEILAWTGDDIVAINHSHQICSTALQEGLQLGPVPHMRGGNPKVFVVRGEGANTQLYSMALDFSPNTIAVDDILLHPPEIVDVSQKPARDVISLDDLWPMLQTKDHSLTQPSMISAYRRLPASATPCVQDISVWMGSESGRSRIQRSRKTNLWRLPNELRPGFCSKVLARRIPPPPKSRLNPVAR